MKITKLSTNRGHTNQALKIPYYLVSVSHSLAVTSPVSVLFFGVCTKPRIFQFFNNYFNRMSTSIINRCLLHQHIVYVNHMSLNLPTNVGFGIKELLKFLLMETLTFDANRIQGYSNKLSTIKWIEIKGQGVNFRRKLTCKVFNV